MAACPLAVIQVSKPIDYVYGLIKQLYFQAACTHAVLSITVGVQPHPAYHCHVFPASCRSSRPAPRLHALLPTDMAGRCCLKSGEQPSMPAERALCSLHTLPQEVLKIALRCSHDTDAPNVLPPSGLLSTTF